MTNRKLLGWLAAAALVSACGTTDAPEPLTSDPAGRVRFVNLITDPGRVPVNAILEDVPFGVNLAYTGTTPASLPAPSTAFYAPILAGPRELVLQQTSNTSVTVGTINFTVVANTDYTVYAMGGTGGAAITSQITTDDNTAAATNVTRFRVANMSSTSGAVDVFLTATGADLSTATPDATNVTVNGTSPYFTKAPGSYQIRFVPQGTAAAARNGAVSITIAATTFAGGTNRTIVAANNAAGAGAARGFVLSDR
jgi:hypothetical protein